jgi:hypothetical protein
MLEKVQSSTQPRTSPLHFFSRSIFFLIICSNTCRYKGGLDPLPLPGGICTVIKCATIITSHPLPPPLPVEYMKSNEVSRKRHTSKKGQRKCNTTAVPPPWNSGFLKTDVWIQTLCLFFFFTLDTCILKNSNLSKIFHSPKNHP